MMSSTKTSLKAMAQLLGITVTELRKTYAKELRDGPDYVYAAVTQKMVGSAIGGDIRAGLAVLRQFYGWQEVTRREITGKNGEPISFRNLDAAALASIVEALSSKSTSGRSNGRDVPQIEAGAGDVVDLEALSGATDEGAE
jgi:hypothetical protein